jgi:hypothetical protein
MRTHHGGRSSLGTYYIAGNHEGGNRCALRMDRVNSGPVVSPMAILHLHRLLHRLLLLLLLLRLLFRYNQWLLVVEQLLGQIQPPSRMPSYKRSHPLRHSRLGIMRQAI